jgi:hypothetical protein
MAEAHAMTFLDRLGALKFEQLGAAVRRWQSLAGAAWFDAERSVARAILAARAHAAQERLIDRISELFRRARWFTAQAPGAVIGASDASGQYVTTIAALALLVCEELPPGDFELLYRPFAAMIPLEQRGGRAVSR